MFVIFVIRERPFYFSVKYEMAIFFLVNGDFVNDRKTWFSKIIYCFILCESWCLLFITRHGTINNITWPFEFPFGLWWPLVSFEIWPFLFQTRSSRSWKGFDEKSTGWERVCIISIYFKMAETHQQQDQDFPRGREVLPMQHNRVD